MNQKLHIVPETATRNIVIGVTSGVQYGKIQSSAVANKFLVDCNCLAYVSHDLGVIYHAIFLSSLIFSDLRSYIRHVREVCGFKNISPCFLNVCVL